MGGNRRMAMALAALLLVIIALTGALAENDTDKAAPPAGDTTAPEVTVLNKHEVEGVLGRDVRSATDENMGRVVGGFLGVGSRKIAVDWSALHFPPPGKPNSTIALDLTRDQVKAAPEYKDGKAVVVLGALGKLVPLPE